MKYLSLLSFGVCQVIPGPSLFLGPHFELLLFVWFEWSVSPVKMAVFSRVQLCNRGEFTTNHHHFDTNPKQQQRRKWPTCVDSTCERTESGGDNVIVLNAFYIDVFWFEGLMLRVVFHTVTEIVQIKCRPSVSLCFSSWMRFTQQFKVSFALIISKGYLIWLKKSKDNNVHRRQGSKDTLKDWRHKTAYTFWQENDIKIQRKVSGGDESVRDGDCQLLMKATELSHCKRS